MDRQQISGKISRPTRLWTGLTAIVFIIANLTAPVGAAPVGYYAQVGAATSQGVADMNVPLIRNLFNVDGTGLNVGIISDSFNVLGQMAGGVNSGDLPGAGNSHNANPVNILREGLPGDTDHGRALAEVIHDIAPGANIMFHAAFNSPHIADYTQGPASIVDEVGPVGPIKTAVPKPDTMATAIQALVAAGADIIVTDAGYFNDSWYADGVIAKAITAAYNGTTPGGDGRQVPVFTSAGHFGNNAWEGTLNNTGFPVVINPGERTGTYHAFTPTPSTINDLFLHLSMEPGEQVSIAMQWAEPFPQTGTTSYDLDLVLKPVGSNATLAKSNRIQINPGGGAGDNDHDGDPDFDPWELLHYTNETGGTQNLQLLVKIVRDGLTVTDPTLKILFAGDDIGLNLDPNATFSPTVVGHPAATGAFSIATLLHGNYTPGVSGVGTPVDPTSSHGPTTIVFNEFGQPIIVPARQTPMLTGPDGVDTTFFTFEPGVYTDQRYYIGHSAAAAHIAGAAALLMQAGIDMGHPLSPDDVYAYLMNHAINIAHPDQPDFTSGYGFINLQAAMTELTGIPEPATLTLLTLTTLALGLGRTRGRKA